MLSLGFAQPKKKSSNNAKKNKQNVRDHQRQIELVIYCVPNLLSSFCINTTDKATSTTHIARFFKQKTKINGGTSLCIW